MEYIPKCIRDTYFMIFVQDEHIKIQQAHILFMLFYICSNTYRIGSPRTPWCNGTAEVQNHLGRADCCAVPWHTIHLHLPGNHSSIHCSRTYMLLLLPLLLSVVHLLLTCCCSHASSYHPVLLGGTSCSPSAGASCCPYVGSSCSPWCSCWYFVRVVLARAASKAL